MDISSILGMTGLLATIIFGAASVYLVIRKRYPGKISFVIDREIALFEDIVRNLPELSVTFNGSPVSDNLVLIRFYLINTGEQDIAPPLVHQNLQAHLPNGYSWRTAKVVAHSKYVESQVDIVSPSTLAFNLGLFRRDEHVAVEAVAEVPARNEEKSRRNQLQNAISFDHRIADTSAVRSQAMPITMTRRRKAIAIVAPIYFSLCVAIPFMLSLKEGQFHYRHHSHDGGTEEFTAQPKSDGTVELCNIQNDHRLRLTLNQLKALNFDQQIVPIDTTRPFAYLGGVVALLLAAMYSVIFVSWRRARKLRRLLGEVFPMISPADKLYSPEPPNPPSRHT
jgi:hypothetical protein